MSGTAESIFLDIEGLQVGFKSLGRYEQVVHVDRLQLRRGEALGLVGESGSGKTVLALAVLRLLHTPPAVVEARRLELAGHDMLSVSEKQARAIRGRDAAMIFQDPMSSLNPVFTVGTQMTRVINRVHGERGKRARVRAIEFIRLVGLPDAESMLAKYPHQLSGGQRQRVIIALALCCDAKLIIADEPTRNLDVTVQAGVLKTLDRLRSELDVGLLFIANNLALVSAMCSRVGVLLDGRIVESGTVDEVVGDARHPYTRLLLRAIPAAEERRTESGLAPACAVDSTAETDTNRAACDYYSRCAEAIPACREAGQPMLRQLTGSHEVACWACTGTEAQQ